MNNEKDWLEYFELMNGRKPSLEEYFAAKLKGEFTIETDTNKSVKLEKPEIHSSESHVKSIQESELTSQKEGFKRDVSTKLGDSAGDFSGQGMSYPTYRVDQRGEQIGFGRAVSDFFRGYVDFKGYTTRAGYWYASLYLLLMTIITTLVWSATLVQSISSGFLGAGLSYLLGGSILYLFLSLLLFLPSFALTVRRLRDVGFNTQGLICFQLIVIVGSIIPFIGLFTSLAMFVVVGFYSSNSLAKEEETFWFRKASTYEEKAKDFQAKISYLIPTIFSFGFIIFLFILPYMGRSHSSSNYTDTYYSSSYSSSNQTVDMDDYEVTLNVDGETGSGTARAEIKQIPYLTDMNDDIEYFLQHPDIHVSKTSGLSNGDLVEVELSLDKEKARSLGLTLEGTSYTSFRISKLDEKTNVRSGSSHEDTEAIIKEVISNYRRDINEALASRDGTRVAKDFTSVNNSSYLYIKNYVENQSLSDGVASYDSQTVRIYDVQQMDDTIRFTLDYSTITQYVNGENSAPSQNTRQYVLKKINGRYLIESF